ncbi:MAG: GNAT family N-acetyltransferase [Patescibacteria group bacterium]
MNLEIKPGIEKFNIKKLEADDAVKYREIRLKGLETDPQSFGDDLKEESKKDDEYWKRKLSKPDRSYYAAEENNIFISTAGAIDIDSKSSMIVGVYTLPEHRGKKISTQLINSLLIEAKRKGLEKVSLQVNIENEDAIKVYERIGFKIVENNKNKEMGDKEAHSLYLMEKDL